MDVRETEVSQDKKKLLKFNRQQTAMRRQSTILEEFITMTQAEKLPFKNHKDTKNIKKFLKQQQQVKMNLEAKDKFLAQIFKQKCELELEVKEERKR